MRMTVGDAVEEAFSPILGALGFRVVERVDEGRRFEGRAAYVNAAYVWRDGDLQVTIEPRDGGERIWLALYLEQIGSEVSARIGNGVAESEEQAIEEAPIYATGLREATKLLSGDAAEIERARAMRWWDMHPEYLVHPSDISER